MPPTRKTASNKLSSDGDEFDTDSYRQKRDRNNLAVKRSRYKSKQKTAETQDRINKLKKENEALEDRVKVLSNELQLLRELFVAHAANSQDKKLKDVDLDKLLADEDSVDSTS